MKLLLFETKYKVGVKSIELCCHSFYCEINLAFKLDFGAVYAHGAMSSYNADHDKTSIKMNEIPIIHCPYCGAKIEIKWIENET